MAPGHAGPRSREGPRGERSRIIEVARAGGIWLRHDGRRADDCSRAGELASPTATPVSTCQENKSRTVLPNHPRSQSTDRSRPRGSSRPGFPGLPARPSHKHGCFPFRWPCPLPTQFHLASPSHPSAKESALVDASGHRRPSRPSVGQSTAAGDPVDHFPVPPARLRGREPDPTTPPGRAARRQSAAGRWAEVDILEDMEPARSGRVRSLGSKRSSEGGFGNHAGEGVLAGGRRGRAGSAWPPGGGSRRCLWERPVFETRRPVSWWSGGVEQPGRRLRSPSSQWRCDSGVARGVLREVPRADDGRSAPMLGGTRLGGRPFHVVFKLSRDRRKLCHVCRGRRPF